MSSPRRRFARRLFPCIALLLGLLPLPASAVTSLTLERERVLMGTRCALVLHGEDREALDAAATAAFDAIARCEDEASNWRNDSELARVNAAAGRVTPVSPGLFAILASARKWAERTAGAFDATVEPLTRAYDLRAAGRLPDAVTLAAARALVAGRTVELDAVARTVLLPRAGMAFDLGGIAKGEALDRAVDVLRARGVKSALLNFGGQVSALGAPAGAEAWTVTLADPRDRARGVTTIALKDASVSTSAASEHALPVGDTMLNHILDPRTGLPAADWGAAAVIATRGVDADAASTALYVMGPAAARAFVRDAGDLEAVLLVDDATVAGGVRVERVGPAIAMLAAVGAADPAKPSSLAAPSNDELARRIEVLSGELDDLKLGEVAAPASTSRYGLGPAASKVYGVKQGVSLGGYGEMLYENFAAEREDGVTQFTPDQIDFLRAIVYVGYKFSDKIVFNSELEFEHATTGKRGSVSVEFACLDYLARPAINLRAGMVLPPMGFVNELHEPPTFLGARRPEVEQRIIPSTWRANGLGVFGETASGLSYRAYVVESFRGVANAGQSIRGFTAADGVREARQSGSFARVEQWGLTGLVEYRRGGVRAGISGFTGGAAQGDTTAAGESFTGQTQIWEAHGEYKGRGLSLRALYAYGSIDEPERFNERNAVAPGSNASVGSRQFGWYAEAGYDVLRLFAPGSEWTVTPYVRYERYDTQDEVPVGYAANPANDRTLVTAGAALYPHPQVVLKADQQWRMNEAETGQNQFNVALGYLF